jgi:hypothetical protein
MKEVLQDSPARSEREAMSKSTTTKSTGSRGIPLEAGAVGTTTIGYCVEHRLCF